MVDKTTRKPAGIIKYFMIKIEKLSFLVDFTVLNVKEGLKIPLILARSFMNASRMLVDIEKGQVKVMIKDHGICFYMIGMT